MGIVLDQGLDLPGPRLPWPPPYIHRNWLGSGYMAMKATNACLFDFPFRGICKTALEATLLRRAIILGIHGFSRLVC